jgi:hypothetical protein
MRTDGKTDMTKLIVTFAVLRKCPKTYKHKNDNTRDCDYIVRAGTMALTLRKKGHKLKEFKKQDTEMNAWN